MQASRSLFVRIEKRCLPLLAGLAAMALSLSSSGAAQVPAIDPPSAVANFTLVKSEFIDDPRFGKDPFYPTSTRRHGQAVTPVVPTIVTVTELTLNGISGSRKDPLAIINYRTFAVGESAQMRIKGQVVNVTCVEINDKVVKITVNGIPQELSRTLR
jgi:hypothetical protein